MDLLLPAGIICHLRSVATPFAVSKRLISCWKSSTKNSFHKNFSHITEYHNLLSQMRWLADCQPTFAFYAPNSFAEERPIDSDKRPSYPAFLEQWWKTICLKLSFHCR